MATPIPKHRNGDSHRKEHSTEELKSFKGFNLSQPHSGAGKAFPEPARLGSGQFRLAALIPHHRLAAGFVLA